MDNIIFNETVLNQTSATDEGVMTIIEMGLNSKRSFSSVQGNNYYASSNTRIIRGFLADELVCINVFMGASKNGPFLESIVKCNTVNRSAF